MAMKLARVDAGYGDTKSMASAMYSHTARHVDFAQHPTSSSPEAERRASGGDETQSGGARDGLHAHFDSPVVHVSDAMSDDDIDDDTTDSEDGGATADDMYVGPEINRRQSMVSSVRPPPYSHGIRHRGSSWSIGARSDADRSHDRHAHGESHTDSHVDSDAEYSECPSPHGDVPTIQVSL